MPNVITRYRKDAGLTEQQLADQAEVSRDYIVKLEQTMYTTPSGKVIEVLCDLTYAEERDIIIEYESEYALKLKNPIGSVEQPDYEILRDEWKIRMLETEQHPHICMRQLLSAHYHFGGSQVKWAKTFGIHQGILNKYELGKTNRMPVSVRSALGSIGVPHYLVEELNEAVQDWCEDD